MADPIEEQVNLIIDEIDASIEGKYPYRLRDLFEHPLDFKDRQYILVEIDKLKADVSAYFERRRAEVAEATKAYAKEAAKAGNVAKGIDDAVKAAAKSSKKQVIAPLAFARNEDNDDILFVDRMDDALPGIISALAADSLFIADVSIEVENAKAGRWVFPSSAGKNRCVFVSFPVNPAGALDIARDQMTLALDAVKGEIVAQLAGEGKRLPYVSAAPSTPIKEEEAPVPKGKK